MSENKTTVRRDRHQHRAWRMNELFQQISSWVASDKKGTKQKKARWGRAGSLTRSRRKTTRKAITRKRMTSAMMKARRQLGQNARSGRKQ